MIPGVNPRQVQQMMKQLGMSQEEMDATCVIIKTPSKTLVFDNPSVQKISMRNQTTFQLSGDFREEENMVEISISDDDVNVVCEQAGVSDEKARKALERAEGDIAQAIVNLNN